MFYRKIQKTGITLMSDEEKHKMAMNVMVESSGMMCEYAEMNNVVVCTFFFDVEEQRCPQMRKIMIDEFFKEYREILERF